MKKVEATFISSKPDMVMELLSTRCSLDIALCRTNHPRDRGRAMLLADPPVVRLEAVVSDVQAMPTVQAILRALRNAPGIDVVSIGVSKVDSQAPRLRESLPPHSPHRESLHRRGDAVNVVARPHSGALTGE
jgi:hypothetical protein